ncbi:MAG: hypothetical protein HY367_00740 [Candidatus Aenigmarchaeota archaeon]|nr:hypothetical protein [Candidatus Aenigmarchaeota archaeon]
MKLGTILRKKMYGTISAISTLAMLAAVPIVQSIPNGLNNIDLWFKLISPLNFALYVLFSITFGLMLSLQVYNLREVKSCPIKRSASAGGVATFMGFIISACPACISLASFFLPLGAALALEANSPLVYLASILLMLLGVHLLGGFRKN